MTGWLKFKSGNYNKVYKSSDGKSVLKIQKTNFEDKQFMAFDKPERSVRLWNLINPHIGIARVHNSEHGKGWVCPFVPGVTASDLEISNELIAIFNRTGRIIVDASGFRNFLRTPEGKIVCVDMGMALQMEPREPEFVKKKDRRKSITSQQAWRLLSKAFTQDFFKESHDYTPQTIDTIKALLFIKLYRPDIDTVDFLKQNTELLTLLATCYDKENPTVGLKELNRYVPTHAPTPHKPAPSNWQQAIFDRLCYILNYQPDDLENIKNICKGILANYMSSRGYINYQFRFFPSTMTVLFRDQNITKQKALIVDKLFWEIKKASSVEEIEYHIQNARASNQPFETTCRTSGLSMTLSQCNFIITASKLVDPSLDFHQSPYSSMSCL